MACIVISGFAFAESEEVINSIEAIRELSPEVAEKGIPLEIEGQITFFQANPPHFFIHDGKLGIYVDFTKSQNPYVSFRQGEIVRVRGVTHQGFFMPHIVAHKMTSLGVKPLLESRELTPQILENLETDCEWVEFEAFAIKRSSGGERRCLYLFWNSKEYQMFLPQAGISDHYLDGLIGKKIRIKSVMTTLWNNRRQLIGRSFRLNSSDDIELVSNDSEGSFLLKINELLKFDSKARRSVQIKGRMTYKGEGEFYLQEQGHAILVRGDLAKEAQIGQELIVNGIVAQEPFSPSLDAWKIDLIPSVEEVEALSIEETQKPFPLDWHNLLVSLKANVVHVTDESENVKMICEKNGSLFDVFVSSSGYNWENVFPGAVVQLTGICVLKNYQSEVSLADKIEQFSRAENFSILLHSEKDLLILSKIPWWNKRRVVMILCVLLSLALISLFWVTLLRKKVRQQTEQLRHRLESEVGMRERMKLARDLHDSLEQNVAGLSRQISTIQRNLDSDDASQARKGIYLAQRMAAHCQKEFRESIHDLRRNLSIASAGDWQDEFIIDEAEQYGVSIDFKTIGKMQERDAETEVNINKIVREATYNALKHGNPNSIKVTRIEKEGELEVSVIDDGQGFDQSIPPKRGHFGLQGMRERASRINATLLIDSEIGSGTRVALKL